MTGPIYCTLCGEFGLSALEDADWCLGCDEFCRDNRELVRDLVRDMGRRHGFGGWLVKIVMHQIELVDHREL